MKKIKSAVSFKEAQNIILNSVQPLENKNVSIMEAFNRVLFEDIVSDITIPPEDDSAMDGYAVIADNTHGASKSNPVKLRIIGEIQAGDPIPDIQVLKGTAIRIMTGAPLPKGADSVIEFEDTEEEAGYVKILRETVKHKNCRFAGENIKKGDKVLQKGDRLNSADIGILASLNYSTVNLYKQPVVSVISTGNELVDLGEPLKPGQIRNSNAYILYSEIKKYNAIPKYLGIVRDNLKETKEIFLRAIESDVIISTGGVSMGKYDFVKDIYSDLNVKIVFDKINIKPGRPCTFGIKDNKLFFGLPGNPVSTLTSFIQFVRPALLKLMGAKKINKPVINAILEENIGKKSGKVNLLRGYFTLKNNEIFVKTTGNQNSSVLVSMSNANCLIVIPENVTQINAGEKVEIQLIEHEEI